MHRFKMLIAHKLIILSLFSSFLFEQHKPYFSLQARGLF